MRRFITFTLGALVLGGLATSARAQDKKLPEAPAAKADAPAEAIKAPAAIPADAAYSNGNGDGGCCWHATGDVGFYELKPQWRSNPAYILNMPNSGGGGPQTIVDFDHGLTFIPRISIGVENNNGFGFRVNWWQFISTNAVGFALTSANQLITASPLGAGFTTNTDGNFTAKSTLRMVVFDFEATKDIQLDQWALKLSGGVRYAHISQNYNANFTSTFGEGDGGNTFVDSRSVSSGTSFNGAGPTASIDVQRRLGNSNFSLYANARGSLLFGRTKQAANSGEVFKSFNAFGQLISVTNSSGVSVKSQSEATIIPVGELELGVRWERDWGRRLVYVQAAFVGQVWFEAGNSSRSAPVLGPFTSQDENGASPLDNDLGLLGFTMTAGLRW
jgi:hypothetical protein